MNIKGFRRMLVGEKMPDQTRTLLNIKSGMNAM